MVKTHMVHWRRILDNVTYTLALAIVVAGCGGDTAVEPVLEEPVVEWFRASWAEGEINIALIRPDPAVGSGPRPVIVALPWGGGTQDLLLGMLSSYWDKEPAARGYYVVGLEVLGSSLAETAGDLIPAVFEWMDQELEYDPSRVVLVGASNGGRGVFFAATSQPERFAALIGMPGRYEGDGTDLAPLVGKPIRLMVGQLDQGWVSAAEATQTTLAAAGVDVTLDVVPGQGHVLRWDQTELMDWIDQALAR